MKNKRIAIILGGLSKERDVSIKTGTAVMNALKGKGYDVFPFDPKQDDFNDLKTAGAAFIALHGQYGEDGCIQGFLETLKIPYTGSGVLSSAMSYDKITTKNQVQDIVTLPKSWSFTGDDIDVFCEKTEVVCPVIVKPSREGSTFGMTVVKEKTELAAAIQTAKKFCSDVLIEQYIQGTEVTVSVLNGKALPIVEIVPKSGFYDFAAKYTPGKTEYFAPARIPADVAEKISRTSEAVAQRLGCRGAPRVDYMLDEELNDYFLEINTIPGMTETSLLPKAAKAVGIDFASLCEEILLGADLG
jgi:D-alanine-D-alanine ligase